MCRIAAYENANCIFAQSFSTSVVLILLNDYYLFLNDHLFCFSWIQLWLLSQPVGESQEGGKRGNSSHQAGTLVRSKFWEKSIKNWFFFFKTLGGNNQALWLPCSRWRQPPLKTRSNPHPRRSQVREVGRSDLVPARQLLLGVDLPPSWTASIVLIARWGWCSNCCYSICNLEEFCRTC